MEKSFFEPYLVYCDELKSEDFKTSSVIIFQGDQIPNTFSLNTISSLLESEKYPWLFIAKEVLKINFYIAVGFEEDSDTPTYVTNILCTFIRNKVFISNVFKCSKNSSKLLKICRNHINTLQLDEPSQEQNKESNETSLIFEDTPDDIEKSIETINLPQNHMEPTIEETNENNDKEIETQSVSLPSDPSSLKPSVAPIKPLFPKWTEKLPQFKWETPIKEYSIAQTEIEASLGLFNDVFLVEDITPLKSFQNIAHEKLMFAPHSSEKFIDRIISHESIFDIPETQNS